MVRLNCILTPALTGIRAIQPVCGWINARCYSRLHCEGCGRNTDLLELSTNFVYPVGRKRTANLISECICGRKGYVSVQFPEDVKDQEKMCVMKIEAEGLMPLDGSLKFGPGYVAIDLHGRTSKSFNLEVNENHMIHGGNEVAQITPNFTAPAAYGRRITVIDVAFERDCSRVFLVLWQKHYFFSQVFS